MSPLLYTNTVYIAAGTDAVYLPFLVGKTLSEFSEGGCRILGVAGISVTWQ